jgi:hypothetical protein
MVARGPLDLAACRRRYRKQQRRYRRAVQDNHRRRLHQLENWLLKSHTAKVVALAKAAGNKATRSKGAQKKRFKLTPAKLDIMASILSCWEDPSKPAVLYFKKKKSGGVRPIFSYGIIRAAQQYMAVGMLEPRLWLHEGQYALPGRDRTAAIEVSKQLIRDGYHWVIRGDIKNYYPSMNGEEVLEMLPGPRAVLRRIILPPTGKGLSYPSTPLSLILQVRRGLPPGAASTALVAAAALAPVLLVLPGDVVVILYADDFAIFAKSKAAAANAMNALEEALRAAPVGDLRLRFCKLCRVIPGFKFLEYYIFLDENEGQIARPLMADFEKLDERLSAMGPWFGPLFDTADDVLSFIQSKTPSPASPSSSGFMPKTPAELHADKMACLLNWRCSYAAWDGDEHGDAVLTALLSNHFAGDLEAMLSIIHARAKKTKLKAMRRFARSHQVATSWN